MEVALEAGAEDMTVEDDVYEIVCKLISFDQVKETLDTHQIPSISAEITMIPKTTVKVEGKQAEQILKLMEVLEDSDDVQQVYANFNVNEHEVKG